MTLSTQKDFIKYINAENNRLLIVTGALQTRNHVGQVFDMAGRKVYQSSGAYRNTTVPLNNLSRGVYTVLCRGDKKNQPELSSRVFVRVHSDKFTLKV